MIFVLVLGVICTLRSVVNWIINVDYSSKSRSCVSFDSFKANEIELLNVTNLEIARLCGSFSKEKYYRMENFGENC